MTQTRDTHFEPSTNGNHANGKVRGSRGDDVSWILEQIVDRATRPLTEMQALPAEYYSSEALYDLELERIFRREWLYVCRADEISKPGDWYSVEIAGEPVMIVRGADNQLRALSRACPHRFMDVLGEEDDGRAQKGNNEAGFVCPYHSWAFGLDGSLTGAPLMSRSELFERERSNYCLESYRTEVWNGFVFVNFDAQAAPLAPRLAPMDDLLAPYRLDEWRVMQTVDWPELPVSWRIVMDNGRECYHHQGSHRVSVEPLWPSNLVDADTNDDDSFYWERLYVAKDAAIGEEDGHLIQPVMLPPLDNLTPYQRSHSLLVGVYPTMWFTPSPDVVFAAKWWPTGPQSHKFQLDVLVHQDQLGNPDLEKAVADAAAWGHQIQVEDARACSGIQRMLRSGAARRAGGGALSHLERPLWQFQKYMANRLTDANV
jgi:phenylpropionate dioxygenase-like ring-hydroxylating dioxygenase large terminal subunit